MVLRDPQLTHLSLESACAADHHERKAHPSLEERRQGAESLLPRSKDRCVVEGVAARKALVATERAPSPGRQILMNQVIAICGEDLGLSR